MICQKRKAIIIVTIQEQYDCTGISELLLLQEDGVAELYFYNLYGLARYSTARVPSIHTYGVLEYTRIQVLFHTLTSKGVL